MEYVDIFHSKLGEPGGHGHKNALSHSFFFFFLLTPWEIRWRGRGEFFYDALHQRLGDMVVNEFSPHGGTFIRETFHEGWFAGVDTMVNS